MRKTDTAKTVTSETGAGLTLETAQANLIALSLEAGRLPSAIQAAANAYNPQEITRLRRRIAEVQQAIPDAKIIVSMLQQRDYERIAIEANEEAARLYSTAEEAEADYQRAKKARDQAFNECQDAQYRAREFHTYSAQEKIVREAIRRELQKADVDRALNAPITQSWG